METEKNPWTTVNSIVKMDNDWIRVSHHNVVDYQGNNGVYGTVHFKNLAIGVIPVDEDMNTYLVGQYRYPLNKYSWEIPEGGGPLNTPPLDSAERELKEETGIVANNYKKITEMHLSNSVSDEHAIIYIATGLSFYEASPEECEALSIKKTPLQEAFRMVDKGEITDSMSVAGLQKIELMLIKGELEI
ncbi:NUDIX hydrolase [Flavobacteriales bacterium]|nr:NUDIX hydrolase [Flavobacteriales bacterium]